MKRSRKYVGLDVHQATTVITVRDDAGHVLARTVVATEAAAMRAVVRGMRGEIHVVLEEGTQAQWLYELLAPLVHQVIVCNRRGEPSHGNKADQSDADELSELLRCGRLRAVDHGSPDRARLKELARDSGLTGHGCARSAEIVGRIVLRGLPLHAARPRAIYLTAW